MQPMICRKRTLVGSQELAQALRADLPEYRNQKTRWPDMRVLVPVARRAACPSAIDPNALCAAQLTVTRLHVRCEAAALRKRRAEVYNSCLQCLAHC